jgi:hypothetical protein
MPFLAQFKALQKSTPMFGSPNDSSCENCDYNAFLYKCKDCFLSSGSSELESCFYVDQSGRSSDCSDSTGLEKCELCYECVDCSECYNCNWCQDCINCTDLLFSYDCVGCQNCFGCVGLRKQQYRLFDEQLTKEEFEEKIAQFDPANEEHIQHFKTRFEELKLKVPRPYIRGINIENVTGDNIKNSKNTFYSFNVNKCEDCCYAYTEIDNCKDCVELENSPDNELCYNVMSIADGYNVHNSWFAIGCKNCDYCQQCFQCQDCFGCISLKSRQYCILNEQYTKEEYEQKVEEIKKEMIEEGEYGMFIPSMYPVEDTLASEHNV